MLRRPKFPLRQGLPCLTAPRKRIISRSLRRQYPKFKYSGQTLSNLTIRPYTIFAKLPLA